MLRRILEWLKPAYLTGRPSPRPNIPGWIWVEEFKGMQMYRDADGDALSLAVGHGVPQTSNEDDLRRESRAVAESRGAGLVEAAAVSAETGRALTLIYKRLDKPAFTFTGMLMVAHGDNSWVWTIVAHEHGTTGVREAVVTAQLMETGKLTPESYETSWARDPYDPAYVGVDRSTMRLSYPLIRAGRNSPV